MQTKPSSPLCRSIPIGGKHVLADLSNTGVGKTFIAQAKKAIAGEQVCWGIPFTIEKVHVICDEVLQFALPEVKTRWLCFMHTAENIDSPQSSGVQESFLSGTYTDHSLSDGRTLGLTGAGHLSRVAATYYILYADGSEERYDIRYRHQINTGNPTWGENCFQAVAHGAPYVYPLASELPWGLKQTIYAGADRDKSGDSFMNWICAWENPHPEKAIVGMRIAPGFGAVLLSAMAACETTDTPIRWNSREKFLLSLPEDKIAEYKAAGGLTTEAAIGDQAAHMHLSATRSQLIQLDMGAVLSVVPRFSYNNSNWGDMNPNTYGEHKPKEFIVEYAAHPDAQLYPDWGSAVKLSGLKKLGRDTNLSIIPPANQRVVLNVIDKKHRGPVAVRLHIHGEYDEYLTPVDRHRMPNNLWFEDYAPEFTGPNLHNSTYIDGRAILKLPLGTVYLEISKGLECQSIYRCLEITASTTEITIEIEKVLNWREKGWLTADTHVHFLSPKTANLEGAAEDIQVVNLLASQWGGLMTNAGDFDGKTTFKNSESQQDYLVRVGTENRQHVLGHISLLGYEGPMITPMCVDSGAEAAIGDPVEALLTEWAKQCQQQGGLVVLPHFPSPRAENAATIVSGHADAIEMDPFAGGIRPYSLVNWYRYLNCGYQIPLTGGTDKMSAEMEVGRIRTYSKLPKNTVFSYDSWMQSIRQGNTFVTFGPLLEFSVNGHEAGSRVTMSKTGGTVTVAWQAETIKHTMTGVELVVNGEVVDGKRLDADKHEGYFELTIKRSSWICLLIRGLTTDDDKERVLAHTSSVMLEVEGSAFFSAPDAISMLDQIEGSLAYIKHIGTQAETRRYKAMRLVLEQAYKTLHDRLHQSGYDHSHDIGHQHH